MIETNRLRRSVVLAVCCVSVLLVGIDMTAVNVALPAIGRDFDSGIGGLSWAVDAYTLTLAALLMFSSSTADRVGRKRVFLIGLGVFVTGSALCAIAPDLGWLVVFRVLQAVGGSMLAPVAMAILSTTYPEPAAQARALGVWGGATGLSLAVGPIAGGALVGSGLGWRWIFAINIPIGLIAIVVTTLAVAETKAAKARRPDPVGQLLVMIALVGLTYAIIEGGHAGWTRPAVLTGFVVAVAALAGIAVYEPRRDDPMLELRFFRSVPFSGANVIAVASFAAVSSFLFLNSFYLQQGRGFSALQAGLLITPLALGSLIYGPINGRILARWGARPCLVVAGVAFTAGGVMLTGVGESTSLWWLLIAYALFGLGNAAVSAPITRTAVAGMPRAQAGLAAGVSAATRQVGATIGVAIAGATLGAHASDLGGAGLAAATHTGWWLAAGYGALTLVLAVVTTTRWAAKSATGVVTDRADTSAVALVERLYEAMNTGDPRLIDDVATNVLAPDWANEPAAPGQAPGADGFRSFVPRLRNVWPDFTLSHDEIVVSADESRVAVRSTGRVTHSTGEFLGLPATGRVGELHAFDFHHIAGGRIQRSFHLEDFLGLLMQLDAKVTPARKH